MVLRKEKGLEEMKEHEIVENDLNDVKKEELSFEDVTLLSQYGKMQNEQLEDHADVYAGYNDYEQFSFASKRKLRDLCTMYRLFFENDPKWNEFLQQMVAYTEIDAYTHEDYVKEIEFVKMLPEKIKELNEALDDQETALQKEIQDEIKKKTYQKLSEEGKKKMDHEFTIKQEIIDNRRRALASFDYYFETQTRGTMSDLEDLDDDVRKAISNAKPVGNKPKHVEFEMKKNGKVEKCYFINGSGVQMNNSMEIDWEDGTYVSIMKLGLNACIKPKDRDMRDYPIFPHEPRMTDIDQACAGNCYIYSGLSELARLYPQKIRDMIRDNGDGTATVRFYARKLDKINNKNVYFPVYVRVDKAIPDMHFGFSRLNSDALWVNLIERAYAMSGLHLSAKMNDNLPMNPELPENKNWRPELKQIEGGSPERFLRTVLAGEGMLYSLFFDEKLRNYMRASEKEKKQMDPSGKMETALAEHKEKIFNFVVDNIIHKGLPISISSESKKTKYIHGRHAYSIIGAYKTDDVPAKYVFRLKNPWTKTEVEKNGLIYKKKGNSLIASKANVKDGVFDILMEHLFDDCKELKYNFSPSLVNTPHLNTEGYDIIRPEEISEYNKTHVTAGLLTDLMKVSNDLYDTLMSSNSIFSRDSEAYKNLVEGMKDFRHQLSQFHGREINDLKLLTEPLRDRVRDYMKHVNSKKSPSTREKQRYAICELIGMATYEMNVGRNPETEFEKKYARTLMRRYHMKEGKDDLEYSREVADKLLMNNKEFRRIAGSRNVACLYFPSKDEMKKDIKSLKNKLNGRGMAKGVNLSTMKPVPKKCIA